MRRILIAVAICAVLAAGPALAVDWRESGFDDAQDASTPDLGPAWEDVAWQVHEKVIAGPIIVGSRIVAATIDPNGSGAELKSFDIDTGTSATLAVLDRTTESEGPCIASDGTFVYYSHAYAIDAYPLTGGSRAWSWPKPAITASRAGDYCGDLVVSNGTIYSAREEVGIVGTPAPGCERGAFQFGSDIAALDSNTGAVKWYVPNEQLARGRATSTAPPLPGAANTESSFVNSLSLHGPILLASVFHLVQTFPCDSAGFFVGQDDVIGYGAVSGAEIWRDSGPEGKLAAIATVGTSDVLQGPVTGGNDAVAFARIGTFAALNVGTGAQLWNVSLGQQDTNPSLAFVETGSGIAFDGSEAYTATPGTLYAIDTPNHRIGWSVVQPVSSNESFGGLAIAGGNVYVITGPPSPASTDIYGHAIKCFAASTGALRWRLPLEGVGRFAIGDEAVAVSANGTLTLIGHTEASPRATASVSSSYPAVGENVAVDLAKSLRGLFGPATRFSADWGDGTTSGWQSSPRLQHAYQRAGEVTAHVLVGNDANQTASAALTFHVGEPAPNLLTTAFDANHQNYTLFILGLAVTGAGSVFTLARFTRRSRLLRRELAHLERAHERLRARPEELEEELLKRRHRALGLLAARRLDEAQERVLEARIDEIQRATRLHEVDEELAYLPFAIVREITAMLRDGRINAWERDHLLAAIRDAPALSDAQREHAREVVERWAARDAPPEGRG